MEIEYYDMKELSQEEINEKNHIFNSQKDDWFFDNNYAEITNILNDEGKIALGKVYFFSKWENEELKEIAVYKKKNKIIAWEPTVEKLSREKFISELKAEGRTIFSMRQGYIDGRKHHLGNRVTVEHTSTIIDPGYQLWIEIITNRKEELDAKRV